MCALGLPRGFPPFDHCCLLHGITASAPKQTGCLIPLGKSNWYRDFLQEKAISSGDAKSSCLSLTVTGNLHTSSPGLLPAHVTSWPNQLPLRRSVHVKLRLLFCISRKAQNPGLPVCLPKTFNTGKMFCHS